MNILGISAYFHDSAAAIISDGEILAAAQEERFSRIKHDSDFPAQAIQSCLTVAKMRASDIDHIVFYDKPLLKFERLLETYLAYVPKGFASFRTSMPLWLKEKLFIRDLLDKELRQCGFQSRGPGEILFSEHHLSHAASAFYPSPLEEAGILTIDGVGEWTTTSVSHGKNSRIEVLNEIHFPHSLGLLYSAFTCYCGFKVNSGEYKLMGLAPYGEPEFAGIIRDNLIDVKPDGSYRLNMEYFDYPTGLRMTNSRFNKLFGARPRKADEPLTAFYMNIAASIQSVTEEVVEKMATHTMKLTGSHNLCMAGGVALNCVANGKLLDKHKASNIWVQPASGDAGGAIGAALAVYYNRSETIRIPKAADRMQGCYLGDAFEQCEIEAALKKNAAIYEVLSDEEIVHLTAEGLAEGKAVGWFQGRMEFGPRALGNRSVLADPRNPDMQKNLNLKIKFRESFRPFAPVVLKEEAHKWFVLEVDSPYMMYTVPARNTTADEQGNITSPIPAATHVDGSSRVQTVNGEFNPKLYALLKAFQKITGCPVLVNTSFNVRGEPIVHTPGDAYHCFMATDLDVLVIGNCFLRKDRQPEANRRSPKLASD